MNKLYGNNPFLREIDHSHPFPLKHCHFPFPLNIYKSLFASLCKCPIWYVSLVYFKFNQNTLNVTIITIHHIWKWNCSWSWVENIYGMSIVYLFKVFINLEEFRFRHYTKSRYVLIYKLVLVFFCVRKTQPLFEVE